jgi:hypothetical protein
MKMEQCSETSAYKIQTPGNYPEENIKHEIYLLRIIIPEIIIVYYLNIFSVYLKFTG